MLLPQMLAATGMAESYRNEWARARALRLLRPYDAVQLAAAHRAMAASVGDAVRTRIIRPFRLGRLGRISA